jgi:hypothetical protein
MFSILNGCDDSILITLWITEFLDFVHYQEFWKNKTFWEQLQSVKWCSFRMLDEQKIPYNQ